MSTSRGEARFNGRVGMILEVAPNQFVQYVLKETECSIKMEREVYAAWDGPFSPVVPGPTFVKMELFGRLVSKEEAERPVWVPAEPTAEIEAPVRAIEGGPS